MSTLHTNAQHSAGSLAEQQLHVTPLKSHRFLFLDALRGIAALFVVVFHLPNAMTSGIAGNGLLAVDFFFCLSGFVIAFSYEHRLTETLSFKDFSVARLIRLYPIYVLGTLFGLLTASLVQHIAFYGAEPWWTSLSFFALALFLWPTRLSPIHQTANYPLNVPAWSLFYEIFANLAYALLVKLRAARTAVLLCIVAGSLALLVSAVISGHTLNMGPRQDNFGLGFARVTFSFFLGVLICRFYRSRPRNANAAWVQRFAPIWITVALIGILSSPLSSMRTEIFRLISISVLFPTMVYCGAVARLPASVTRLSTVLGELSYPLYLLHAPFASLMAARRLLHFTATHTALIHCIVPCIVLILALLSWQVGEHLDLPIRRALTRRYNSYKQAKQTHASSQASAPKITTPQHDEA